MTPKEQTEYQDFAQEALGMGFDDRVRLACRRHKLSEGMLLSEPFRSLLLDLCELANMDGFDEGVSK